MIIAVDFDGTCVVNSFPKISDNPMDDVPYAAIVLRKLVSEGHKIILFTCRCDPPTFVPANTSGCGLPIEQGQYLTDAINWFTKNKIQLWGINYNPTQTYKFASCKPFADLYIDDKAFGAPLINVNGKPAINWKKVYKYIHNHHQ
jgi:hypothetical protein